ncbi:hypothetical protein [Pontixanthobacter gangjinensis]|uniref:Uncharacterized protein n=1 Tax=Pontixanthobacter gangjinensis TaxID=1028742 RepID=A0A6I4SR77_9SPHN|nr:hypothetical protein [Pontixanthobacter gangjinensis]MXO57387.1 hypothetical protein [Pontixanthobacter gangjinensis]
MMAIYPVKGQPDFSSSPIGKEFEQELGTQLAFQEARQAPYRNRSEQDNLTVHIWEYGGRYNGRFKPQIVAEISIKLPRA